MLIKFCNEVIVSSETPRTLASGVFVKLIIIECEVVLSNLKHHALIAEHLCTIVSMDTLFTSLTREYIQSTKDN